MKKPKLSTTTNSLPIGMRREIKQCTHQTSGSLPSIDYLVVIVLCVGKIKRNK